jgi:hypothetical protein
MILNHAAKVSILDVVTIDCNWWHNNDITTSESNCGREHAQNVGESIGLWNVIRLNPVIMRETKNGHQVLIISNGQIIIRKISS